MSAPGLARRLAELRRCGSAGGRAELGCFSIEGTRLLERALRADAPLLAVVLGASFVSAEDRRIRALLTELRARPDLELHVAPDAEIRALVAGRSFGDVLALVRLPTSPELADCLGPSTTPFRPGLVCVVDAEDPGNVGALVRTSLASGARAFIAVGNTDPFHPKAVRTSMGSLLRLPILHYAGSDELLEDLERAGVMTLGAVAMGGAAVHRIEPSDSPLALFLGSEAFGLSEELADRLDARVTIPMLPGVDSLSINAAAAVCLYELLSCRVQGPDPLQPG